MSRPRWLVWSYFAVVLAWLANWWAIDAVRGGSVWYPETNALLGGVMAGLASVVVINEWVVLVRRGVDAMRPRAYAVAISVLWIGSALLGTSARSVE